MPTAWDVGYYVLLPFVWLAYSLLYLITTIAAPVFCVARSIWGVCLIPLRFLYRFEVMLWRGRMKPDPNFSRPSSTTSALQS